MESKSEVSQELESSDDTLDVFDAIIIGAGAAGIGAGIALAHSGVGSFVICLLYTSPSPRDATLSRMPSSA